MKQYVLVIDEGTTGTRALIFNRSFEIVSQSYEEFTQYTPAEDRVEHDAEEIYDKTIRMCKNALEQAGLSAEDIAAVGITNQRATSVVWDKNTGKPLYRAIVWQDSRTAEKCRAINGSEWGEKARKATGWTVAPVYSSLMLNWMIENVPEIKDAIEKGTALFGTIDTWLIWKLTGGAVHATSYSNASVMGSYDLYANEWYKEFLDFLGVPVSIYPEVREDSGDFGSTLPGIFGAPIKITADIADQHSALYAQGCRSAGQAKCTNGTGTFLDINIGETCSTREGGINTVIAWCIGGRMMYAVEGYVNVTGSAIQWLRDGLEIIKSAPETEAIASSVPDTNGVYFVPALTGLGAPFWDPFARGLIIGITRGTTRAHIVRAALEAIALRTKDITETVAAQTGIRMQSIKIDGGASKNNLLAQMFADFIDCTVERPSSVEATSLGAAQMAGLAVGMWQESDFDNAVVSDSVFTPQMDEAKRNEIYSAWKNAVERSKNWLA
ncbi:MAG: FGGY family carbohydrate kinase [Bacillota bacterium]